MDGKDDFKPYISAERVLPELTPVAIIVGVLLSVVFGAGGAGTWAAALFWLVPVIPVPLLGAVLIVVFGFFFATVSSRMVGLVGSSNNPVSGMAIATLLIATIVLKGTGYTGVAGMTGAIAIGSVICIIAAIAGDTSQDLKTGYILGATPRRQQIGEVIGVTMAASSICWMRPGSLAPQSFPSLRRHLCA